MSVTDAHLWPRSFRRSAAVGGLALMLAGCSVLGGSGPPPAIYDLVTPVSFPGLQGRTNAQLLIPPPSAINALNTDRIVVRPEGEEIAYYPGVTWSDQLPLLIQTKLIRSFENSAAARVARPGDSLAIDYQVILDIRAFEAVVSGAPAGRVTLGVRLLNDRDGRIVASRIFEVVVPAANDSAEAAINALNTATEQVMREIVEWTVEAL
jgi:cholesterol transport system auxiliary component